MLSQTYRSCIEACNACAAACNQCMAACLRETDPKPMVRCIGLDIDCAAVCQIAASMMARGSLHTETICTLCAEICEACAEECVKHNMAQCQACARACKHCAEACHEMVALA